MVDAWSGPAITAKLFLPLLLAFIAAIATVPIDSVWTGAWCLLVMAPIAGFAIWMFTTIGEIRPAEDGVRYRRWIVWHFISSNEILNVIRVFPCFAAIISLDGAKRYFFPDPRTTQYLRALSGHTNRRDPDLRFSSKAPLLTQLVVLSAGALIGVFIRQIPQISLVHYRMTRQDRPFQFERRYLPISISALLVYLAIIVIRRQLRGRELYLSLGLLGLGIVYVCDVFLPR